MNALTEEKRMRIIDFANYCELACLHADQDQARGWVEGAKAQRAMAAYWSGRAFGEVLA